MSVTTSTIVGALACQKNSFLRTLNTNVVSSLEYKDPAAKKKAPKLFAIEFEDTVLFPEGGGQPYDTGVIKLVGDKTIPVQQVVRDKLKALHLTQESIEPGTPVTLNVDWDRRIDLMQQHTGQHLLSAILDSYDLPTLSWSMGDMINYVELPRKVDDALVQEVNQKVNDAILQQLPILVVSSDEVTHSEADTSSIPADYDKEKGVIRVIKIGDLDSNTCCGTHLQNTGQIQAISLLHQINVRAGNSRLHFICGSRVYKYLQQLHEILKTAGSTLLCQMGEINDKIELLNLNYKKASSRESALLKKIAAEEATRIFKLFTEGKTFGFVYWNDPSPEFLTLCQKELATMIKKADSSSKISFSDKQTIVYLNGDTGTGGMVKMDGPKVEDIKKELQSKLANMKGGGRGNSFQGKVVKYEKGEIQAVLKYLEELNI